MVENLRIGGDAVYFDINLIFAHTADIQALGGAVAAAEVYGGIGSQYAFEVGSGAFFHFFQADVVVGFGLDMNIGKRLRGFGGQCRKSG